MQSRQGAGLAERTGNYIYRDEKVVIISVCKTMVCGMEVELEKHDGGTEYGKPRKQ